MSQSKNGRGRKRRVLIIVENLPVPFDRRVWMEATALARQGYDVSVICPTGKGFEKRHEIIEDVAVYRHPLLHEADGTLGYLLEYGGALFWELVLATRVAFTRGFDVIQICNPPDLLFLVCLPFKLFGKKMVFDQHDLGPETFEAKFQRRGFLYKVMLACERMTYALADVVIATNNSYRKVALTRGRKQPKDVFVVRSGPDLRRWVPAEPDPKWLNGRKHAVGYVGVMGVQEGIDLLLESARHIVHDLGRTDIQFILIGDGTERTALMELTRRLDIDSFVTFTGRVPDADLISALSSVDVCINPDRPNELNDKSTMNKIIEYMALAKPIVQFDLEEGRYSAGQSSLYAAKGDTADLAAKIIELVDDPARRAEMGAFGRRRVEQELSWNQQEGHLLAAYNAVFGVAAGQSEPGVTWTTAQPHSRKAD